MYFVVALAFSLSWLLRSCRADDPQAIVVQPSQYFEGNDGPWSSFHLRVGTPEQTVRVLVSTASPEMMVVLSDLGCQAGAFAGSSPPSNCAVSRGVLFNPNTSSSWIAAGRYGINGDGVGLEANLGYTENADFGLETVGVDLTGPKLLNQTVAGIATSSPLYLGVFGLNNQPVNYSNLGNYSAPSFITTLKDKGAIPSVSWSYTAGAPYRLKQVYGQLVFSGYDRSRFDPQNTGTFTMAGDLTRDLVVYIQSISYSGANEATLLSDPIQIFIDSTDPNLWLPGSACDAFEKAFGLTLDKTSGLYLVNDTHHTSLLSTDAKVSFRLSDVKSGGQAVTITLPYDAFALTAKPPLVASNSSYYFPLKRAVNSTQYTLGRVFLQEAYLSADYERNTFNVSPCAWVEGAKQDLVTILPKDGSGNGSTSSSSSGSGGLGKGAIAGIVIGCVVAVALLAILIVFLVRRRNVIITYTAREPNPDEAAMSGPVFNSRSLRSDVPTGSSPGGTVVTGSSPATVPTLAGTTETSSEIDGRETYTKGVSPNEGANGGVHELHGQSRSREASDTAVVHELPGSTVPGSDEVAESGGAPASRDLAVPGQEVGVQDDAVSTVGALPTREVPNAARGDHSPPSPGGVSTLSTVGGWHAPGGDAGSDIVSPTTPVRAFHRGSTSS